MTYINKFCADVGTVNCPCPLAETGDCLICGRLAGKDKCDCDWAGVCIYNEYIQNDKCVRSKRNNKEAAILKKIRYDDDIVVMVLKVSKGFALKAAQPGSFVFVNAPGASDFSNVPVSVMKTDIDGERIYIALKIISGKTKAVAEAEKSLMIRGVYRNGLLGKGLPGLLEDVKLAGNPAKRKRWLVITKGIGFAPAVNLSAWTGGRTDMDFVIDTEKVNQEIIRDYMKDFVGSEKSAEAEKSSSRIEMISLAKLLETGEPSLGGKYDRVIIMASDYYIKYLAQKLEIPSEKLVFCNNFRMCCGEGICGACSHIDKHGNVSKMCKCREMNVNELL